MSSYDPQEERLNVLTHSLGAILAFFGSICLLFKGFYLETSQWFSLWVYCFGLLFVLCSSSLYHNAKTESKRIFYKKLDHTAIYYLIAGTYTPFLYINIPTQKATYLLIALWTITFLGTVFKILFVDRFEKFSLIAYLSMGWFAVLIFGDMRAFLKPECLTFIIWGGIAYSIGAIFYALQKIRFTHAIWHIFVLLGAILHFIAIYQYAI